MVMENLSEDDSFDELKMSLPKYQCPPQINCSKPFFPKKDEDQFQTWVIERFNRTGPIPLFDMFSISYSQLKSHLKYFILVYLADLIPIILVYFIYPSFYIANIFHSIFHVVCFTSLMSIHLSQKVSNGIQKFFSVQGIIFAIYYYLALLTKEYCYFDQSKIKYILITIYILVRLALFYLPCLVFDAKYLGTIKSLSFLPNILFHRKVLFLTFLVLVFEDISDIISPLALGLPIWFAVNLQIVLFESICGSSNRMSSSRPDEMNLL